MSNPRVKNKLNGKFMSKVLAYIFILNLLSLAVYMTSSSPRRGGPRLDNAHLVDIQGFARGALPASVFRNGPKYRPGRNPDPQMGVLGDSNFNESRPIQDRSRYLQVSKTRKKLSGYPLTFDSKKSLMDTSHPQYHPAFARNIKPAYLLDWSPSPDSLRYFQPVNDTTAWVYSAYYVDCSLTSVRVMAISVRHRLVLGPVYCHFFDAKKVKLRVMPGRLLALKDNHLLNHTAAAIDCVVRANLRPWYVSITKKALSKPTNQVKVTYPAPPTHNLTVCFSPLHSIFNATYNLIQSIELNRLLGASHFFFYNFSTSPQTDQILRHYQKRGLVSVLPWPLPHLNTWYYGQVAAINDCIYRNRMLSKYVAILDTDEFIIPATHSDLPALLRDVTQSPLLRNNTSTEDMVGNGLKLCPSVSASQPKKVLSVNTNTSRLEFGSFMFRCAFVFGLPLSSQNKRTLDNQSLCLSHEQYDFFHHFPFETIRHLKRNDFFYDFGKRSKLIVRPETVVSFAIHKAKEHIAGFRTAFVQHNVAFLHHYRQSQAKTMNTLAVSALRFKDRLYERLRDAVKEFPGVFPWPEDL